MATDPAPRLRVLRIRLTASAVVAVLAVLVIAGTGLVVTERQTLRDALESRLRLRANDVALVLERRDTPAIVAGAGGEDTFVQVVRGDDRVMSTSAGATRRSLLPNASGAAEGFRTTHVRFDNDRYLVFVHHLTARRTAFTVITAGSLAIVSDATTALARGLALAIPLATSILAVLSWWLIGRILKPVAAAAERQAQFVADAAHELRTPLARMRTELEVDLAYPQTADLIATHQSALAEVATLQTLLDDLLQLARTDAGADSVAASRVEIDQLVRSVVATLENGPIGVDIDASSSPVVMGDGASLGRAVRNLVDNAVRHARSNVTITVGLAAGYAMVVVSDDGPGVSEQQRERIFERFARVDAARSADDGGAGLGLAIARSIAEHHQGTLTLDHAYEAGAQFVLRLPAVADERGEPR